MFSIQPLRVREPSKPIYLAPCACASPTASATAFHPVAIQLSRWKDDLLFLRIINLSLGRDNTQFYSNKDARVDLSNLFIAYDYTMNTIPILGEFSVSGVW